jgi:hypothetical protein
MAASSASPKRASAYRTSLAHNRRCLEQAALPVARWDLIACTKGPVPLPDADRHVHGQGPFLALGKPWVALPTLVVSPTASRGISNLFRFRPDGSGIVVPVLDARKNDFTPLSTGKQAGKRVFGYFDRDLLALVDAEEELSSSVRPPTYLPITALNDLASVSKR